MFRRSVLSAAAAVALWLVSCVAPLPGINVVPSATTPVAIAASPVFLDEGDPARTHVGRLVYRGGLRLTAPDGRFGGWSDLRVSADGARFTAVSDESHWMDGRLDYDARGRLAGISGVRLGPLIDLDGRPLRGKLGDAEGLVAEADGSFIVSFERWHRFWRYPAADPPFSIPPAAIPHPPELDRAPANGGVEAIIRLADGRLMAIAEELYDRGGHVGWVQEGTAWGRFIYRAGLNFKPTALALLPGGDVLALERRFTVIGPPGARIVRVPLADIAAGATLAGDELALIEPPLAIDNFEGLSTARGPRGETLLYVISDDNYSPIQRTLLLMFELAE
ncbi:MAG: esterase-like activity of phytase family protein [Rhodospirillales bacterium]|nr:esterase-like activity of phytase family protein [Rhodospirillales bacterium]